MTVPDSLHGRVALVTGASSGFGQHFARVLARAGAKLVLCARRADRVQALADEIAAGGGNALAVAMDVTSEASVSAAYDAAQLAFGTVDTVIANAGTNHFSPATDLPMEDFDAVVGTNLRGVFLTVREGGRRLLLDGSREREHGRIVIVSSITANVVDPGLSVYSATKAGVVQMGKVLAKEWVRKGINVNILCPGYVQTEISGDWFDSPRGQQQIAGFNRKRLMDIKSLDGPLLFFCSDGAKGVTGSVLTVDDGQSL